MAIEVNPTTSSSGSVSFFILVMWQLLSGSYMVYGRKYSELDTTIKEPQGANRPAVEEVLQKIAVSDANLNHYQFDREAIKGLEEYLGVFVGHLSGPFRVVVQQAEGEDGE